MREYPENRLDIRIDEEGNISFEENKEFASYYMPDRNELCEELEMLEHELDMLLIDEPENLYGDEHDDWEDSVSGIEEQIDQLRAAVDRLDKA